MFCIEITSKFKKIPNQKKKIRSWDRCPSIAMFLKFLLSLLTKKYHPPQTHSLFRIVGKQITRKLFFSFPIQSNYMWIYNSVLLTDFEAKEYRECFADCSITLLINLFLYKTIQNHNCNSSLINLIRVFRGLTMYLLKRV